MAYTNEDVDVQVDTPMTGLVVIRVSGEVDIIGAPLLRRCVDERLPDVRALVLDLGETTFFGAAGLSALVHTSATANRHGIRWALVCPPVVLRPLRITDLDRGLPVCTEFAEALAMATTAAPALSRH